MWTGVKYEEESGCLSRLKRYRSLIFTCLGTSFIAAILSVEAVLVIHFLAYNDSNNYDDYSPNDTRTIPFNYQLCQGLTLTSKYSPTFAPSATLFLLHTGPHLNGSQFATVSETVTLNQTNSYESWVVNMYNGSNVSIYFDSNTSCPVTLYLIKGGQNFSSWKAKPDKKYSVQHVDTAGHNLTYSVSVSDTYYVVVYQPHTTTKDNATKTNTTSLNVTMELYRTKYTYPPSSIAESCSIDTQLFSCSIGVPFRSGYTALIVFNDTSEWRDTVSIGVNCISRAWVFVLVTLAIFLVLILVFGGLVFGCAYARAFMRTRGSYERIN